MQQQNSRKHPRFQFGKKVFNLNKCLGTVRDISLGGCFIETEDMINNVFDISIPLSITPNTQKTFKTPCKAMWSKNGGMGTKFFILSDENRMVLSQWLFIKKVEESGIKT